MVKEDIRDILTESISQLEITLKALKEFQRKVETEEDSQKLNDIKNEILNLKDNFVKDIKEIYGE